MAAILSQPVLFRPGHLISEDILFIFKMWFPIYIEAVPCITCMFGGSILYLTWQMPDSHMSQCLLYCVVSKLVTQFQHQSMLLHFQYEIKHIQSLKLSRPVLNMMTQLWGMVLVSSSYLVHMRTLVPEVGISGRISNCIPQYSVGCNYLSLPEIPASGTKVLIQSNLLITG